MDFVVVRLPDHAAGWEPPLFPGSAEAIKKGCTCPEDQPWPGRFTFNVECPVHELEKADS